MKINELNIHITKALIEEIHISLNKEETGFDIYCKGGMYTSHGKKVSDFQFGTDWYGDTKIQAPAFIAGPCRQLFEALTPVIYEKINGTYRYLARKNK